jgi:cobalt-zinc-cadmium efflux system outer membrane protein
MQRTDRAIAAACCGLALTVWTTTSPIGAQSLGAEQTLTLPTALERALASHPGLAATRHRIAERDAARAHAELLPNPQLALEVEDFAGGGEREGVDAAQTTLGLAWVLEGPARRARIHAAESGSALASAEADLRRLEVAADTAEQFLESLTGQARLERAEAAIALAERTVEAVGGRVRAGRAPRAELARAEAELATDRLARDDVTHELAAAYHRLAAQWGEPAPDFTRVEGDLLALPVVASFDELAQDLERNPQLVLYASEERLARADLKLGESRRWPSLRPALGVRRYEATDDYALVAGVSVPIPVWNRGQGEIAGSRATLARTRAEADAARVRVRTTLFALYEELRHHFHRAETLRDEVIPRLTEAMDGTRLGYERGRYGYGEVRSVQADLLRAEDELLEASAGAHRLVIALERLTGEKVSR